MTIDALLAQVAARGFLVNNLFQLGTNHWRANLRRPLVPGERVEFYEFGDGPTAADALTLALRRMPAAPPPVVAQAEAGDLEDMLS